MATTLTATFDTRCEAELMVEELVQDRRIDRTAVFIAADTDEEGAAVADADAGGSTDQSVNDDWSPADMAMVVVELDDGAQAEQVKDAFVDFNSAGVVEN